MLYFNTEVTEQEQTNKTSFFFLNTTRDATEPLVAAIYRPFESDGGH